MLSRQDSIAEPLLKESISRKILWVKVTGFCHTPGGGPDQILSLPRQQNLREGETNDETGLGGGTRISSSVCDSP